MTSAEEVLAHYKSEWETKIRNMKPGRELDALVAEKAMGWTYGHPCPEGMGFLYWADEKGRLRPPLPYSTDISAAWEVVEKFEYIDVRRFKDHYGCTVYGKTMTGKTAPEAICKAALLAVIGEDEAGEF